MSKHYTTFNNNNFKGLVGVSEEDMTAPVGIYSRNWGAALHDKTKGNNSFLKTTCYTIKTKATDLPYILISAEICLWRSIAIRNRIFKAIFNKFNIPSSHLLFCLTHTHSGPVLSLDFENRPGGDKIATYIDYFESQILKVIESSLNNLSESIITWNYGKCSLAKNRDFYSQKEGRYLTGFNPKSTADDTLLVGRITDIKTNLIKGIIANYACHPTTLAWQNELLSGDYVTFTRELIEQTINCPILFLQGASGELAPKEQYTDNFDVVKKNGKQLAYSILATLEDMLPANKELYYKEMISSGADLAYWDYDNLKYDESLFSKQIDIEYKLKKIPQLAELELSINQTDDRLEKEKLTRLKYLRLQLGDGETATIPLWIWKIGNSFILAQQNEAYSHYQLTIRKCFPDYTIAVVNIANGSAGYLPPSQLYDQDCYTVKQTPFAKASLEKLIEISIESLQEFI